MGPVRSTIGTRSDTDLIYSSDMGQTVPIHITDATGIFESGDVYFDGSCTVVSHLGLEKPTVVAATHIPQQQ